MTDSTAPTGAKRVRIVLELEPLGGVETVVALRQLLKVALRRFGLKCRDVKVVKPEPSHAGSYSDAPPYTSAGPTRSERYGAVPAVAWEHI